MVAIITVKVQAEHANEREKELPAAFEGYRMAIEKLHEEGIFGDPTRVRLRWMLDLENFGTPVVIEGEVVTEPVDSTEPISIEEPTQS